MKRAIRVNDLQPGDVLLTRNRLSPTSKGIASIANSEFSHASMVVSPLIRVEATREGVGYTSIPTQWYDDGPSGAGLYWNVSRYGAFKVLRHPDAAGLTGLADRIAEQLGRYYASYIQVAGILEQRDQERLARLLRNFRRISNRCLPIQDLDGVVCSELVVDLLERVELSPVQWDTSERCVWPGDLLSNESNLKSIPIEPLRMPRHRLNDRSKKANAVHMAQTMLFEELRKQGFIWGCLGDLESRLPDGDPARTAIDQARDVWCKTNRDWLKQCCDLSASLISGTMGREMAMPTQQAIEASMLNWTQPIVDEVDWEALARGHGE